MKHLFGFILVFLLVICSCSSPSREQSQSSDTRDSAPEGIHVDSKTQQQVRIVVRPVTAASLKTPISATGRLQVNEDSTWKVGAIISGKIVSVPVHLGDIVRAGQIVAQMHSHEVYDSRASRRQAVAELDRLKALADQALRIRDRTKRLLDLKAASREQMEAAETTYRSSQLSVANAQAEVEKAEFHLTNFLEVPLNEAGKEARISEQDRVPIKAPATGTVMERLANAGTVVSAGDPVITMSDLSILWLIAAVNEADLSQIHRGQTVQISVRAYPDRKFTGKVFQLGERMDPQTRTLQVRVSVVNSQNLLKPDMFATAEFSSAVNRPAIYLPESAIQELNGKHVVFTRSSSGDFTPQEVTLGVRADRQVEILSGLTPGVPVVVEGALLLKSQLLKGEQE